MAHSGKTITFATDLLPHEDNIYSLGDSSQRWKINGITVPVNAKFTDTNKYHKSGSWNGLTYTATAVNDADELKFTIPTGSTSTTVAAGNHNHNGVYAPVVDGGYLPLSGGTMTGNITMPGTGYLYWPDTGNWGNSNSGVTFPVERGGLQWTGQSDSVKLYAVETASDNLELYLRFGDDNSNGLSIRNKDNTQTARIKADGSITATSFSGNGSALTALNASNISSGTLSADRLATSGATAGSYGPSAAVSGTNGATMNVPYITVDDKGRVTSISNKVYTAAWRPLGTGATDAAAGDHNHDTIYSAIHQTAWSWTSDGTKPLSKYVTFDVNASGNTIKAPDASWFNGFVSSHGDYVASFILNKHRSDTWYIGWEQYPKDNSTTYTEPVWRVLAHSGNVSTGDANGQIKIAGVNVKVKGIAALAYKDSLLSADIPDNAANTSGNAATATTAMTVKQYYTTNSTDATLQVRSNNKNVYIWQAGHATSESGGFSNNYALQYYGEGSSPNNYLILKASNSSTVTDAVQIDENGNITVAKTITGTITNSTWTTLLKPINAATTASASTWSIPSGSYQVWGERFSDTRLKYTPSGGSESTVTDTGDWTMWLTSGGTTNTATLNMRIDGTYYGSFSGNLSGNITGTAANVTGTVTTAHGGTGSTSHTANRLTWSYSATQLTAGCHYANQTKIAVNSTTEPTENFYVNGSAKIGLLSIYDTGANNHINFSRTGGHNSPNYINVPASSSLAFTVGGAGGAQIAAMIDSDGIVPFTTNTKSIGTSTYKWNAMYATTFNGDLSGNATTATSSKVLANLYGDYGTAQYSAARPDTANIAHVTNGGVTHFKVTSKTNATGKPMADGNILHFHWDTSAAWDSQLYIPDGSTDTSMQWRGSSAAGTWDSWRTLLDSNNYSSYALPLSGGTVTGRITKAGISTNWNKGRDGALIAITSLSAYSTLASIKTVNGSWDIGSYTDTNYTDDLLFTYISDTHYNGSNTTDAQIRFLENGHILAALDGTASKANLLNSSATANTTGLQYYQGQPTIGSTDGNAYEGSSNNYKLWSYPADYTAHTTVANIQTIRMYWSNAYWHDIFASPNNENLLHRSVLNNTAKDWRIILDSTNYSSYAFPAAGGKLNGSLKFVAGAQMYDNKNIKWINSADTTDYAYIGTSTAGNIGIIAKSMIVLSANSSASAYKGDLNSSVRINGNSLYSNTNNDYSLGTSTNEWSAVFTPLLAAGSSSLTIKVGTASTTFTVAKFEGSAFLPGTTSARYIGSTTAPWTNIYATTFTGDLTGNATTATSASYLKLVATNEVRFDVNTKPSSTIDVHIGHAWSDGTKDAKITGYYFKNGNGVTTGVTIYAATFSGALSGNASSATQVKVTSTSLPSSGSASYYLTYTGSTTTGNQDIKNCSRLYLFENTTNSALNIGSSSTSGAITLHNANGKYADIVTSAFTRNRTLTLPDATGTIALTSSNITGNAASASKISAKLAATAKTYLLGTATTITATAANVDITGDTGVYLTTTAGELSAARHSWNVSGTEKAYTVYNTTDDSIDFVFI